MAFNSVSDLIVGTVGQVRDLRELPNDNAVINFSLAVTPRKKVDGSWVDDETIWTNVVAWGKDARAFAASNITAGTQLVVHGTRRAVKRDSYVNKSGKEIPERIEQEVTADLIAVAINPFTTVQVTRQQRNGNGTSVPKQHNTSNSTPETSDNSQKSSEDTDFDDPFESNGDALDISDDDLPF